MSSPKTINTPLTAETIADLKAGDEVLINGVVYTGRDAAHKRFFAALDNNEDLPFPIEGSVIFYVGPTPAPPGTVIGSAGPTTSGRMDVFTPRMLSMGLKGMIGKGKRSPEVIAACKEHKAIYFAGLSVAALLSKAIKKSEVVAYEDLGPEAVRRLEVENFPAIVIIDADGNNLYEEGIKEYRETTS